MKSMWICLLTDRMLSLVPLASTHYLHSLKCRLKMDEHVVPKISGLIILFHPFSIFVSHENWHGKGYPPFWRSAAMPFVGNLGACSCKRCSIITIGYIYNIHIVNTRFVSGCVHIIILWYIMINTIEIIWYYYHITYNYVCCLYIELAE